MGRKIKKAKVKNQNWVKIVKWVFGGIVVLVLVTFAGFKIWVSTWQTYRNDEFGFSFKYPKNWYIGGTDITKKQLAEKEVVFFWVDSQPENVVSGETETKRSPGNVEFEIEDNSTALDAHKQLYGLQIKPVLHGNNTAYTYEGIGRVIVGNTEGFYEANKFFDIQKNGHYFYVNSLTYSDNVYSPSKVKGYNVFSILKVRFYHLIGSEIVDSFEFIN